MKTTKLTILCLLMILLFTACSSNKAQVKKYYRITSADLVSTADKKPLTLIVKRPKALSILGGRPIVATQADNSLVQLSYNFWLESPKVLLQDRIKSWATNHWEKVSYQTPADESFQTLETRILAFEKQQAQAVIELEFTLYDSNNQLTLNKRIKHSETIAEDNYKSFAKAMSTGLDKILTQLQSEIHSE